MTSVKIEELRNGEEDAFALAQSAVLLADARSIGGAELTAALDHNLQVWVAIRTLMQRQDCPLPTDIRDNLIKLSHYAAQRTFEVANGVTDDIIDSLINVNLQISEGLLEGLNNNRIKERAYQIWEQAGKPVGNDKEHWAQAEVEISSSTDYTKALATMEKVMAGMKDDAKAKQAKKK